MGAKTPTLFGPRVDAALSEVARYAIFVGRFPVSLLQRPLHTRELIRMCYEIGVKTLPLVMLTGTITGIVFTQQSRPSLAAFSATSWLPSLVTIALVRSIAPLVTALLCAGKVGSSIGAELGSMNVTEQIEAMEVSAVNPYKFLAVTRTLATTLMVPLLTLYFGLMGFLGAFMNVHGREGTSWVSFVNNGFSTITWLDMWTGMARAVTFGFTIGIIASYRGFHTSRGTEGVGRAANSAVVHAMLVIFVEEIMFVQIITFLRGG
jgi:phospholipid/cholesterol/gamma-HCH transport system permease protein